MAKQKRNTRGRIISAAWELFYEQGYEDTTVEEIIERSQTSKGSFYHYLTARTLCCPLFPICLTRSMPGCSRSWIRRWMPGKSCWSSIAPCSP